MAVVTRTSREGWSQRKLKDTASGVKVLCGRCKIVMGSGEEVWANEAEIGNLVRPWNGDHIDNALYRCLNCKPPRPEPVKKVWHDRSKLAGTWRHETVNQSGRGGGCGSCGVHLAHGESCYKDPGTPWGREKGNNYYRCINCPPLKPVVRTYEATIEVDVSKGVYGACGNTGEQMPVMKGMKADWHYAYGRDWETFKDIAMGMDPNKEEVVATKDEIRDELPDRKDVEAHSCSGRSRLHKIWEVGFDSWAKTRFNHKWRVLTVTKGEQGLTRSTIHRYTCECTCCGLKAQDYWTSAAQALASGAKLGPAAMAELGVRKRNRMLRIPGVSLLALPFRASKAVAASAVAPIGPIWTFLAAITIAVIFGIACGANWLHAGLQAQSDIHQAEICANPVLMGTPEAVGRAGDSWHIHLAGRDYQDPVWVRGADGESVRPATGVAGYKCKAGHWHTLGDQQGLEPGMAESIRQGIREVFGHAEGDGPDDGGPEQTPMETSPKVLSPGQGEETREGEDF